MRAVTGPVCVDFSSEAMSSDGDRCSTPELLTAMMESPSCSPCSAEGQLGESVTTQLGFCDSVKSGECSITTPTGYVSRSPSFSATATQGQIHRVQANNCNEPRRKTMAREGKSREDSTSVLCRCSSGRLETSTPSRNANVSFASRPLAAAGPALAMTMSTIRLTTNQWDRRP